MQQQQINSQYESNNQNYIDLQTPYFQQHKSQNKKQQNDTTPSYNQSYTTSITQLISQPVLSNPYNMEYVYQSIYQLSDYLWNKKIMAYYNRQNQNIQNNNDPNYNAQFITFDDYLLPLQDELNKYDKFKKLKSKQEEYIYSMLVSSQGQNSKNSENKKSQTQLQQVANNFFAKQNLNSSLLEKQLIKCYQQVPFIFFQDNFSLDFSNFQDKKIKNKYNNTQKMKQAQQVMNKNLDLIEINLFGQIHRKFQDYFKVAANFDYLKQSINIQLKKLKQSRSRISKVQIQFVIKSQKLRKKIIQRTNYQKIIKKIKLLKSLKKLPSIIQTILQSSLPYQCLQLLKTTKKSTSQLQNIKCVESIINNIKNSQTIVQLGLNKRYTDGVYLYIQQVFQTFNFQDFFRKIDCPAVNQKDLNTSSVVQNLNLSRRSNNHQNSFKAGDRSGYFALQEIGQGKGTSFFNGKPLLKNIHAKRLQQKQYQIAMILLQSFEYIDFPVDVTKIKISNQLRLICRKFQKDMIMNFKKQLIKDKQQKQQNLLHDLSFEQVSGVMTGQQTNLSTLPRINSQPPKIKQNDQYEDVPQKNQQFINKVSIEFYIKHIKILNQLFKQLINRYLGYIFTLVVEYQQKITKTITEIDKSSLLIKKNSNKSIDLGSQNDITLNNSLTNVNSDDLTASNVKFLERSQKMSKMQLSHNKFKQILVEQMSLLPSVFKIIQQKIKHFLTLKNIGNASPQQFFEWISLLRFWQRWFDVFIEQSPLVNYNYTYLTSNTQISSSTQLLNLGQDMIEELVNVVVDNIKKSVTTMSLKNIITDLTINYLNCYSTSINNELYQALLEQSWQSVQIPQQFAQILNGIIQRPQDNQNMSLTILNSSRSGKLTNEQSFSSTSRRQSEKNSEKSLLNTSGLINSSSFKYKILKNNILTDGQRYKLTVSFLLLCQFIEQYIRVGRLFEGITGQNQQQAIKQSKNIKKIQSHLYDKIYQFIDYYNASTKQMILQKKALKTQKIKGNNITVKHICLLSNCLSFLQKITKQIPLKCLMALINKTERQSQTIQGLINHNILLIDKISSILNKRMEQVVGLLKSKEQQKVSQAAFLQFVVQTNQSIVTVFLQITQIIDEYLDVQKCQKILKAPFSLFVQKYFKVIIEKEQKIIEQARILLQKMKFLKKYFKNQFLSMQRQIQ